MARGVVRDPFEGRRSVRERVALWGSGDSGRGAVSCASSKAS